MDIHQMGHRIDGLQEGQIAIAREVAAIPGSVAQHFHRTIDDLEPAHTHLTDVMSHAEEGDCELCTNFKIEYDAKHAAQVRETVLAEQAEAAAAREPTAEEPQPDPVPAPVVPKVFEEDGLDFFGIGAFGMETIEGDGDRYTIKVKPGGDNAELANEAIAEGRVLPANCVLRVGADGKTTYVCDPEPAPAAVV